MEEVVVRLLSERGLTVASAESCTGGYVGHRITNVSGASSVFMQGWITYSNEAKERMLGVCSEGLEKHGAVSEVVARAMAEGARERAGSDFAVSQYVNKLFSSP